jgi:hypothetical protein
MAIFNNAPDTEETVQKAIKGRKRMRKFCSVVTPDELYLKEQRIGD